MELSEAWAVLGEDVTKLFETVRFSNIQLKMNAVDEASQLAERISRRLLGQNHPDKNPGNPRALEKYRRVLIARDTIRKHTEEFRIRVQEILERKKNPPDGHIEIG